MQMSKTVLPASTLIEPSFLPTVALAYNACGRGECAKHGGIFDRWWWWASSFPTDIPCHPGGGGGRGTSWVLDANYPPN